MLATAATTTTTLAVSFAVTAAVTKPGSVMFALTSPVTTDVLQFASREDGATGPQLVLTTTPTTPPPAKCTVSSKLVRSCARWLGIAAQAYSGEPAATALAHDEAFTGSAFALAHEYKTNGTLFPTADRHRHRPRSPDTTGSCSRTGSPPPTRPGPRSPPAPPTPASTPKPPT